MENWPIPDIEINELPEIDFRNNGWILDHEIDTVIESPDFEFPKGWGNPWPDLPSPDDTDIIAPYKIILDKQRKPCNREILGYYMSWHVIGKYYEIENGIPAKSGNELKIYNDKLPSELRFGIHVCCTEIFEYISRFDFTGLTTDEIPKYQEYCTHLTLSYLIAHEWGHYRSELLTFQMNKLASSLTGDSRTNLKISYLTYLRYKKTYPLTNFEEVFAEWASLKVGVFNYHIKKPSFARNPANWLKIESTLRYMLTQAISRPNRIRPYSDIRHWVDFNTLSNDVILQRITQKKKSANRSVNDNVLIDKNRVKSLIKGTMTDMLAHNQMQFSGAVPNGIIRSTSLTYPTNPCSPFYHLGYDENPTAPAKANSKNFIRLSDPLSNQQNKYIKKYVDNFKGKSKGIPNLPIRVFPEILPLDPVYFH